ncbi:MAG: hypothetical protein M3250_02755 [Thermoproteota archaeon]|nr:hypothetical protein [Thermoproteota archaeon]
MLSYFEELWLKSLNHLASVIKDVYSHGQNQQQQQIDNDLIRHRPTGMIILAVLFIIAGAFNLLAGITALEHWIQHLDGQLGQF